MARTQFWAAAIVVVLAALLLISFGVMISALNRPLAPLPTQINLSDLALTQPAPAFMGGLSPSTGGPSPSTGFVHLPPLSLVLTPSPQPVASTPSGPVPTAAPFAPYAFSVGQSVQGRDIVGYAFPITDSPYGLVLVCGIHGDEVNAWPVLQSIMEDLTSKKLAQPSNLSIYFIQSLNPDGTAADQRLNADNIDLNRNWDTYDWRTGVEQSSIDYLPHGGGSGPFSEPETQGMRNLLIGLKATHTGGLTVLYFHAAFPPNGLITPGTHLVNGQDTADTPSRQLGQFLAGATGYQYDNLWIGGYTVTGDASTWAVAQGIVSLTVELPVRTALVASDAYQLKSGLLQLINTLSDPTT
jgi:Zinc carboxypeptidase